MSNPHSIRTLLVANRGEIALRVMRSARDAGIRVIAVCSEADLHAPHARFADDLVCLGPAPVQASYLRGDKVIAAALGKGADAIHPGYGFLSENADFARAVDAAGITFVGPPAAAIEIMGDKAKAKRAMQDAGVPCVPGYEGESQDDERFLAAAADIGFPVMVKAAAGGGGRGMRLVDRADALADALALARSEAENAFGSGELILEKAIERPRHVEVQVFADAHGTTVHLGERDCSVQRRHQKVIEEAPCPIMTPQLRDAMGDAAVMAARAVGYRGAGTVEFLLDQDGNFYFLEMNTRLQVEHPVTELVTGLDLVALQLAVAQGQPLGFGQSDVVLKGHAIEVRLYAEDPGQDFLPSTGRVDSWRPPSGEGIRVDDGIATGTDVSPYYDSMVAKIIAFGRDREQARLRLIRALADTVLFGPRSNRDFLIDALGRQAFARGEATTAFIEEVYGDAGFVVREPDAEALAVAAVIQHRLARDAAAAQAVGVSGELLEWSSARDLRTALEYVVGDGRVLVFVMPDDDAGYRVTVGEQEVLIGIEALTQDGCRMRVSDHAVAARFQANGPTLHLCLPELVFTLVDVAGHSEIADDAGGGGNVRAPMHGLLLEVLVEVGDLVTQGDKLTVLEAMKMQHEILAEVDGTVLRIVAVAGQQVAADDLLIELTPKTEN